MDRGRRARPDRRATAAIAVTLPFAVALAVVLALLGIAVAVAVGAPELLGHVHRTLTSPDGDIGPGYLPIAIEVTSAPRGPAAAAMRELTTAWAFDPLVLAMVGYLLGVVLAEVLRRRPDGGPSGVAGLETRSPSTYLTPVARWLPAGLAAIAVVATVAGWPRWGGLEAAPVAAAVGGFVGAVLGVIGIMGVWGLWFNYGSSHRGRTPERELAEAALR